MSRSLLGIVGLVTLLPLAVEAPPDSGLRSAETRFRVAGGYGYYSFVVTDCIGSVEDHVPAHAYDGAISLDHLFAGAPFRLGVRAGWTQDRLGASSTLGGVSDVPQDVTLYNRYANPFLDYERHGGSVGMGWVAHQNEFITSDENARRQPTHPMNDISFHLRAGAETRYVSVSWMEGMPIYSDGGYLNAGVGGRLPHSRLSAFLGLMAGGPIQGLGPMARAGFDATPAFRITLCGQTAYTYGPAGNVSIKLEYRVPH